MKKLLYITAGSRKWGIGHVRRSSQVISALNEVGVNVLSVVIVPDDSDALMLRMILKFYNIRVSSPNEIDTYGTSAIVVDVDDYLQPEILSWIKQTKLRAFALDWYINDNGVFKNKINLRGGVSAFKYCIVREEFHKAKKEYAESTPLYDLVVVVGGGDLCGHLSKLLTYFTEDEFYLNMKIVVVVGPLVDDILINNESVSPNLLVLRSPDNIEEFMANAYVGITNGGTTLMEFTMLGIPTIVFPQTKREDTFIAPFLELGCGILGSTKEDELIAQIESLWRNKKLRQKMSERCLKTIDGLGANRIAKEIQDFFRSDKK